MKTANTDFAVESQTLDTEVARVTTRDIVDMSDSVDTLFMPVSEVPTAYQVDAKPWLERPFFVDRLKFGTSDARYATLSTKVKYLPGDVARSNSTIFNVFKIAALGRPDLVLNISMSGTIGHAGCILAAILPPLPEYPKDARYYINTAMSGPHAFLNANEATSVVLPVPWYCNTDMMTLDMEGTYARTPDLNTISGNYGTLVFIVLNPLSVSEGSSTELNVIVEACFRNFDMIIPTPRDVQWVSQSGKTSMLNPVYDDYAELLSRISESLPSEEEVKKESRTHRMLRRMRLMLLLGSLTSVTASVVSHLSNIDCLDGDADVIDMIPQAGILSTIGSAIIPGLVGNAVSLGKEVTGDLLDKAGKAFRKWTGLHNPNRAVISERVVNTHVNFPNMIDGEQFYEKLDPYASSNRIVTEPIFGTTSDEMDLTHVTAKDQYLGTLKITSNDDMGKRLWNKPISPFQGGLGTNPVGLICANNLELLHSLHRGWRGGLKLKIQSVMNNKQQVKLKVIKYYNPSMAAVNSYPKYETVVNSPAHLLEFTQGGQMLEVDLPYLSRNAIMPRGENPDFEGVMHGMYYIYLAQPLVTSDGSPANVEFNVYMCGQENLQFYGYVTSNVYHSSFNYEPTKALTEVPKDFTRLGIQDQFMHSPDTRAMASRTRAVVTRLSQEYGLNRAYFADRNNLIVNNGIVIGLRTINKMPSTTVNTESKEEDIFDFDSMLRDVTELAKIEHFVEQSAPLTVMNKPQEQRVDLQATRNEAPIEVTRLMPSINLRDIVRRMYKSEVLNTEIKGKETKARVYPLAKYVSELPLDWAHTPISLVSRMYYGKSVGFKIRLVVTASTKEGTVMPDNLAVRVFYQPQGVNANSGTYLISRAPVNDDSYVSPIMTSLYGEPPFTYQVNPVTQFGNSLVYEFVVPDTSYYKFLGSPEKFRSFDSSGKTEPLSINDFGNLVIQFTNHAIEGLVDATVETFIGLTDESRLGFHSIAPPFQISKSNAFYRGSTSDPDAVIPNTLNPYVYTGGFIS